MKKDVDKTLREREIENALRRLSNKTADDQRIVEKSFIDHISASALKRL